MNKLLHLFADEFGANDMNHDDRARFLKFMNAGELAQKHVDKLLDDNIKLSGGCQQGKSPAKTIISLSIFIHLNSLIWMYSTFDYKTKLHIS